MNSTKSFKTLKSFNKSGLKSFNHKSGLKRLYEKQTSKNLNAFIESFLNLNLKLTFINTNFRDPLCLGFYIRSSHHHHHHSGLMGFISILGTTPWLPRVRLFFFSWMTLVFSIFNFMSIAYTFEKMSIKPLELFKVIIVYV